MDGEVTRPFSLAANRFAAGQRRGVDIATRAGESVRAACTGRVTFAGPVPQRKRGVTIACGALVATHLGLAATRVTAGDLVAAGARIGEATGGPMRLGTRRRDDRFGYVDPLRLLGADPAPPLGAAPPPRGEGPRRRAPYDPPTAAPASSSGAAAAQSRGVSPVALAGLALVLAGVPVGGFLTRRRGRRATASVAVAARVDAG